MNEIHISQITDELGIKKYQVEATAKLLEEGGTVPFIARYRKEATGTLDEVTITTIRDRLEQLAELDKRREAILKSLEERDLLTDELKHKINYAPNLTILEDIYLPYKPKRRTRATIAKEKGLEPLAQIIFDQADVNLEEESTKYICEEKEVASSEEALAGARDIIAEWVSENEISRSEMRELYHNTAVIKSKVSPKKESDAIKYKDYYDWSESIAEIPSHRILAMFRGDNESMLILYVKVDEDHANSILKNIFIKNKSTDSSQLSQAIEDSYDRLMAPSMENEIFKELKERADKDAIQIFAANLRELLMAAPLGQKNVMAIDPGFRTGCKIVCLNRQSKLLHNDIIYLHNEGEAEKKIRYLCDKYQIEAIAVGNGTAGRETKTFVDSLRLTNVATVLVNESGASIYSASEAAREEFPEQDLTVRGAVSIGRRLMDPLAELVKIDPKSIGVGQYQHDVNQTALKNSLDDVVMSCVNNVGVEANTASKQLLTYVSGLGPKIAENIVVYRDENGPFKSRTNLKKVPRLGPKAFEQAAGFLRIQDGKNLLDASAVHPESYHIVNQMAEDNGCTIKDLMKSEELRSRINLNKYITDKIGLPTLNDIMTELAKPGRDPRDKFEVFEFAKEINKIEDVEPGMNVPGIVTNVTAFGAFVDIGVHQDGLVHISQLADRFVKDPNDIVKVHQKVNVRVLEVDIERKRISLSMKS